MYVKKQSSHSLIHNNDLVTFMTYGMTKIAIHNGFCPTGILYIPEEKTYHDLLLQMRSNIVETVSCLFKVLESLRIYF